MKALFITGETSGDKHAANLIASLKKIEPSIDFSGIGGKNMEEVDTNILYRAEKISVVGFSEVISKIPNIKEARRRISRSVKENNYDFAVTVDFPGFNIPIARYLNNLGIPVFYFITPQVWAWGGWRIRHLRKYFRHLFVILPFEEDYFLKEGIKASFLGNPLLDTTSPSQETSTDNFFSGEPGVALLPGSRESEIKRVLPDILKGYHLFKEESRDSSAIIAIHDKSMESTVMETGGKLIEDIPVIYGHTNDILNKSDIAVVTSGTATIEAGILRTPMVIVYRLSTISWLIARLLVRIEHVGLINLIAEEEVAPELIQNMVTPENICRELMKVFEKRDTITGKIEDIKKKLGKPGSYDRIARTLLSMV